MPKPRTPDIDRFSVKYVVTDLGCWEWTGSAAWHGYGKFSRAGWSNGWVYAHRWSYEYFKGEIPDGFVIDHLCSNRLCVNPDHLEATTQRINNLRGKGVAQIHAAKTHCPQGHEYTPGNTRLYNGSRFCRECGRERDRLRRKKTNVTSERIRTIEINRANHDLDLRWARQNHVTPGGQILVTERTLAIAIGSRKYARFHKDSSCPRLHHRDSLTQRMSEADALRGRILPCETCWPESREKKRLK